MLVGTESARERATARARASEAARLNAKTAEDNRDLQAVCVEMAALRARPRRRQLMIQTTAQTSSDDDAPETPVDESKLFGPLPATLSTTGGALVNGVLNVDHARMKFVSGSRHKYQQLQRGGDSGGVEVAFKVPLQSLTHCSIDAVDRRQDAASGKLVRVVYCGTHGEESSLDFRLLKLHAEALHGVLLAFLPTAGLAMRAALAVGGWEDHLGRSHCFDHGDEIPTLIASRGLNFHEADGELRYVLVDSFSRYGYDLVLKLEAKTMGVWGKAISFSLNSGEFTLVPNIWSRTGDALCLHRTVEGGYLERCRLDAAPALLLWTALHGGNHTELPLDCTRLRPASTPSKSGQAVSSSGSCGFTGCLR
jgi:hypothetical protein